MTEESKKPCKAKRQLSRILVTGGAGFIGSHFIDSVLEALPCCIVINMDSMTYAGREDNLKDAARHGGRYFFEKADITDEGACRRIIKQYDIDTIVHFAAESHVDRSIVHPDVFVRTNVLGTQTLLEAARAHWTLPSGGVKRGVLFHHVSTDEVYGPQKDGAPASEYSALFPSSPYSASKAASDLIVIAWGRTYNLPVTISRSSNNYGTRQYPEKFLPLMIKRIEEGKRLPLYGTGRARRNWVHVSDHLRAILLIMQHGNDGGIYNISDDISNTLSNIDLLHKAIDIESAILGMDAGKVRQTIDFAADRPAHDALYLMDCNRIRKLGWRPQVPLDSGLYSTIKWYIENDARI